MLSFEGTILLADGPAPIEIEITEPRESEGGDFYCLVSAPPVLNVRARIFGVDATQARELSVEFLDTLVGERELRDANGRPVMLLSLL